VSKRSTSNGIPYRRLSEESLLHRIRADADGEEDRQAASELLGRYRRQVYVWCHRYLRDHERALDLSQDVLLAAYRAIGRFDGRSSIGTWLFVIARNRCLNEIDRPHLLRDPEVDPDSCTARGVDPEDELLEKEDEETILALIRKHLDEVEQTALWMRCFERMPVDVITRALDLKEKGGARVTLQRARRKLRRALAERDAKKDAS